MNRLIVLLVAVVSTAFIFADNAKNTTLTPEQIQEKREAAKLRMLQKTGGKISRPGSQHGEFMVFNAQKVVASDSLRRIIVELSDVSRFSISIADLASFSGDCIALKNEKKASGIMVVVYDDNTPALLVAPDDCWAIINVKKLEKRLNVDGKKRFLVSRAVKQMCRAFGLLSGSVSQFKQSPCQAVSIEALDECGEGIPMDQVQQIGKYFENIGMTRKYVTTYRQAIKEGWAPKPANEHQQRIWDEMHAIPTQPMVIKPEKHPAK